MHMKHFAMVHSTEKLRSIFVQVRIGLPFKIESRELGSNKTAGKEVSGQSLTKLHVGAKKTNGKMDP